MKNKLLVEAMEQAINEEQAVGYYIVKLRS
jgi:hypothetical protein